MGGRKRERSEAENGRVTGKAGITIGCKSLDKRPGIVKTRSGRGSILILYVASRKDGWASDKGQKSTRVAVFNSDDDCRHSSGRAARDSFYHRNPEISPPRIFL